jgi:hypothetical protein
MLEISGERASYRIKEGLEQVLREKTEKNKGELLKEISTAEGKYGKFIGLLRLLKSSLPIKLDVADNTLKRLFYNSEHLPFDLKRFNFEETNLGNGGQVRVYLLESKTDEPSIAIKVFRPENELSDGVSTATRLKQERNDIENLYSSVSDLVPKEHYIVMEDPFKKGRAAATVIEEFISGKMFDIFSFSPEELNRLATNNPVFKNQLIKFIEITLQNESANGEVVDILGPKNLIAVNIKDGSFRLILLDPHGHIKTKENMDKVAIRASERLDFLKKILFLIEK